MLTTIFGIIAIGTVCLMPAGEMQDPFTVQDLEDPIVFVSSETAEQTIITEEPAYVTEESENIETEIREEGPEPQDNQSEQDTTTAQIPEETKENSEAQGTNQLPAREESYSPPVPEESLIDQTPPTDAKEESQEISEPSAEASQQTESAAHIHTWEDITEVIHHEAEYETVPIYEEQEVLDAEAWDEEVPTGECVYSCLQCSFETKDLMEMGEHSVDEDHNYSSRELTETIHHDAVYHTEEVMVGEEKVLVKDAWDEVIVVGKKCSVCGAIAE